MTYGGGNFVDAFLGKVPFSFNDIIQKSRCVDSGFFGKIAVGEILFGVFLLVIIILKVKPEILVFEQIDHENLISHCTSPLPLSGFPLSLARRGDKRGEVFFLPVNII